MSRRRKSKRSLILGVSVGVHLAVGGALAMIPQRKLREVVAIALNEAPPKESKPEPPKPPPHEQPADKPKPHRVPRHSVDAPELTATSTNPSEFQNLGLTLDSSSSDGIAVPVAPKSVEAPPPPPAKAKVLVARRAQTACDEPLIKARPISPVLPAYTDEARRARIEGRVRMELNVDDRGRVVDARVLTGLGHGLDDAALEAANKMRFAPATRCRKAVSASLVIAMRFVLAT